MKRISAVLCAAAGASLVLSGCANGSNSIASNGEGDIKVMVIEAMTGPAGVDTTSPKGAQAAASAINAAGGIGGRKIDVLSCDSASDPNQAAVCAREAVSDHAMAVVGTFEPLGISSILPVLQAAKIPLLSSTPGGGPLEFNSPISFQVTGGAPVATFGTIPAAQAEHCKSVAVWGDSSIDGGQTKELVADLNAKGISATLTQVPTTSTTDVTPMVSEALSHNPDCVMYMGPSNLTAQLITGLAKTGSKAQFITATASLLPPFLKALGPAANGIIAVTHIPNANDPSMKPFMKDMTKYEPGVQPNAFTIAGWYGVRLIQLAAKHMDTVTPTTLIDQLNKMDNVKLPGLPTLNFTKTQESKLYPRMFNASVLLDVVKNDTYVAINHQWHNVSADLP